MKILSRGSILLEEDCEFRSDGIHRTCNYFIFSLAVDAIGVNQIVA